MSRKAPRSGRSGVGTAAAGCRRRRRMELLGEKRLLLGPKASHIQPEVGTRRALTPSGSATWWCCIATQRRAPGTAEASRVGAPRQSNRLLSKVASRLGCTDRWPRLVVSLDARAAKQSQLAVGEPRLESCFLGHPPRTCGSSVDLWTLSSTEPQPT